MNYGYGEVMADTKSPQDQVAQDQAPPSRNDEAADAKQSSAAAQDWNIDMTPDDVLDGLFGKPKS